MLRVVEGGSVGRVAVTPCVQTSLQRVHALLHHRVPHVRGAQQVGEDESIVVGRVGLGVVHLGVIDKSVYT